MSGAVPATAENMLDEDGNPKDIDTTVMIDGEPHKVTMSGPLLPEAPEEGPPEEPIFEGSANLNIDATGLRGTGEATARISDVPLEGEALGRREQR